MASDAQFPVTIRPMTPDDLPAARQLWSETPGVELAEGDGPEGLSSYVGRNPGLGQVACVDGVLVGAVLVGHDGRRGLLYHLAVKADLRGKGIGRRLADHGLAALRGEGIRRALILVDRENPNGSRFWIGRGWEPLTFAEPMGIDI